jgi:Icc-related predicted phosphoesterase
MTSATRAQCYHGARGGGNVPLASRARAGDRRTVRLVSFGDIHMALGTIARLSDELAAADAAILVGDLTNFGGPREAAEVVSAVRARCRAVLAVTGNLDMPEVIDALRADGISLHGEGRRLGRVGLFGCGGSNVTPMDTPTELGEDEILAALERGHRHVADAPLRVMVCHTPPYDTRLDRLMNGAPVGSPAVREFILTHRPDVALVGHIHEGRGVERLGDTVVANAGALRDGGYVVVSDGPDGLRVELRNLRTGTRA